MKLVAAALAAFLFCTPVYAQPSDRFPDSISIVHDGERHQAFNLGQFVELLRIDADLQSKMEEVALLESEVERFRLEVTAITGALSLSEKNLELVTQDRIRLTELYRTTNQRLHEIENKPNFLGISGWILSTILIGVSVTLGIIVGVN